VNFFTKINMSGNLKGLSPLVRKGLYFY